jgi:uncharacterized protein YabE (DUF348 family)
MRIVKNIARLAHRHRFALSVMLVFLIFFVASFGLLLSGSESVGPSDSKIVSIFDKGVEQVLPTRAQTVEELLQRSNIILRDQDLVEPALSTPILEDNFRVNIYRARPVKVIDGTTETTVLTPQSNPRLIAEDAGIAMLAEDKAVFSQPDNILGEGLIGERMVITRSVPITILLYGTPVSTRTVAKTVGELLSEKGITMSADDVLQPIDRSTTVQPGMLVAVNQPGKQVVTVSEDIAYTSETKNDANLEAGTLKVETAGVKGTRLVLYEIEYAADGSEVGRRQLQSIVTAQPQNEVKVRGTKQIANYSVDSDKAALMAAAGISSSDYAAVDYIITHESHWRPGAVNPGLCIGLGQRCPSKTGGNALLSACPNWQSDPVCQLKHFSAYSSRYGGWQGSYQAWLRQGWW